MNPPTEDTWFPTHHNSTVDKIWIFTTQPRTSHYTPNRGHGLNSIFTSFPSSCIPAIRGPSTVWNVSYRSFVKFHVCVLVWRRLHIPPPHTHTHTKQGNTMQINNLAAANQDKFCRIFQKSSFYERAMKETAGYSIIINNHGFGIL